VQRFLGVERKHLDAGEVFSRTSFEQPVEALLQSLGRAECGENKKKRVSHARNE